MYLFYVVVHICVSPWFFSSLLNYCISSMKANNYIYEVWWLIEWGEKTFCFLGGVWLKSGVKNKMPSESAREIMRMCEAGQSKKWCDTNCSELVHTWLPQWCSVLQTHLPSGISPMSLDLWPLVLGQCEIPHPHD